MNDRQASDNASGWITEIKRYAIHDGPGIRTTIFLKGCPLRCPWCANPETQSQKPHLVFWSERCIDCNTCTEVCPTGAIVRIKNGGRRVSLDACNFCGDCVEACYAGALEIIGRQVSVDELLQQVEADRPFYEQSDGGVTLSGGEPLLQPSFARNVLMRCHKRGIHTTLDTSGHAPWQTWQDVLPHLDLILYDLKMIEPDRHQRCIGVPNTLILHNLEKLAKTGKRIIVRHPVIPGYNDDERSIHTLARFLQKVHAIEEISLLPYHRLALGKYKQLGLPYPMGDVPAMADAELDHLRDILVSCGFRVKLGG